MWIETSVHISLLQLGAVFLSRIKVLARKIFGGWSHSQEPVRQILAKIQAAETVHLGKALRYGLALTNLFILFWGLLGIHCKNVFTVFKPIFSINAEE